MSSLSESLSESESDLLETFLFKSFYFSSASSSIFSRSAKCFLSSASFALFSTLELASAAFFLASLIFYSALLLTSATFSSVAFKRWSAILSRSSSFDLVYFYTLSAYLLALSSYSSIFYSAASLAS